MDVTHYLRTYNMTARELASKMIDDVLKDTGITATCGIGTNLYLCKIAMDIMAKHAMPDERGVRIAELNENSYRRKLWDHRPITDFGEWEQVMPKARGSRHVYNGRCGQVLNRWFE